MYGSVQDKFLIHLWTSINFEAQILIRNELVNHTNHELILINSTEKMMELSCHIVTTVTANYANAVMESKLRIN